MCQGALTLLGCQTCTASPACRAHESQAGIDRLLQYGCRRSPRSGPDVRSSIWRMRPKKIPTRQLHFLIRTLQPEKEQI